MVFRVIYIYRSPKNWLIIRAFIIHGLKERGKTLFLWRKFYGLPEHCCASILFVRSWSRRKKNVNLGNLW